jgi:protein-L-isoaspartate(D-aspartate) O-methyltransferase
MSVDTIDPSVDKFAQQRSALIRDLEGRGYVKTRIVRDAMLSIPRELFVPGILRNAAYEDQPQAIPGGQTISAPHMVATMCEVAEFEPGMNVLEIGAGSGYNAAVMAAIVSPGRVLTTEVVPVLVENARKNLERAGIENVTVREHDGSTGLKDHAPFDRIMVTCASPGVPGPLVKQLKPNGILIIPVGDHFLQSLTLVRKDEHGKTHREERMGCVFVPMRGKYGFR